MLCYVMLCYVMLCYVMLCYVKFCMIIRRPNPVPRRLNGSAATRLLGLWVRMPSGAWMFVSCECCVLSGRGFCLILITRQEESYRVWCVQWVWSRSPVKVSHDPKSGRSATGKRNDSRNSIKWLTSIMES